MILWLDYKSVRELRRTCRVFGKVSWKNVGLAANRPIDTSIHLPPPQTLVVINGGEWIKNGLRFLLNLNISEDNNEEEKYKEWQVQRKIETLCEDRFQGKKFSLILTPKKFSIELSHLIFDEFDLCWCGCVSEMPVIEVPVKVCLEDKYQDDEAVLDLISVLTKCSTVCALQGSLYPPSDEDLDEDWWASGYKSKFDAKLTKAVKKHDKTIEELADVSVPQFMVNVFAVTLKPKVICYYGLADYTNTLRRDSVKALLVCDFPSLNFFSMELELNSCDDDMWGNLFWIAIKINLRYLRYLSMPFLSDEHHLEQFLCEQKRTDFGFLVMLGINQMSTRSDVIQMVVNQMKSCNKSLVALVVNVDQFATGYDNSVTVVSKCDAAGVMSLIVLDWPTVAPMPPGRYYFKDLNIELICLSQSRYEDPIVKRAGRLGQVMLDTELLKMIF